MTPSERHDGDTFRDEIFAGIADWRTQHPKATMREIERELDARWSRLRTCMLQDIALHSVATDWRDVMPPERPVCQVCGTPLVLRGKHARKLQTHSDQDVTLTLSYALCPTCKGRLSPLATELGLIPGRPTPLLQEHLAHLGAWMVFALPCSCSLASCVSRSAPPPSSI